MIHTFDYKIIDEMYCVYHCPTEWHVDETGAVFHRIYYAYDGYAVYEDEHRRFTLKKGYIYIFPTNKPYKISHDPGRPFICLWFHIIMFPVILNPVIEFDIQNNNIAFHLVKALEGAVETCEGGKRDSILVYQTLHSILHIIDRKEKFIVLNDPCLHSVIDHIHGHYMESISNYKLSCISGYDTSYFTRLFKKTFGISPQKYIANYRMSKAVGYIRGNMPVSEVSSRVGYTDVKAFCRAFKKEKGVPPSEYKKSHYLQP